MADTSVKKLRVRVYHSRYGCHTGCCGHVVEVDGHRVGRFVFDHPDGKEARQWATNFAQAHVMDFSPECYDTVDWENIEVEVEDV